MRKKKKRFFNRFGSSNVVEKAKKNGTYIAVMSGVLEGISGGAAAQANNNSISSYSVIAYLLGIGVIILSVLIIRLMIKYFNQVHFKAGLKNGKDIGKEELLQKQEEELAKAEAEAKSEKDRHQEH